MDMIKKTIIFLVTILMVNIMVCGQEQENKKTLIFLEASIFPQAYLQNDMPMVPLEAILNRRYSHTFFEYSHKQEKNKIILQNTSGVDVRTINRLKEDEFIIINLTNNQFVVKNKTYSFSRIPKIIDGNTYVPADFFLTAFGYPIAIDVHSVYIGHSDVQKVCTAKDMILFVEKNSGFALTLELTMEEYENGISDVWKFDIKPTNKIFLYEVMPVVREIVIHSWGYRGVNLETGEGGDYYEEDSYSNPQNCYVFKTPKAGKYEMIVSNDVSTYKYLINVLQ
jgi:hypothetical protein